MERSSLADALNLYKKAAGSSNRVDYLNSFGGIDRWHRSFGILKDRKTKNFFAEKISEYDTFIKSAHFSSNTTTKRQLNQLTKFGFRRVLRIFIKF